MAKEKAIFDDQAQGDAEDVEIRINEKFAKKYHELKRHEELQNLKHVDLSDDEDESDSETEDEDGDQLTADLDKDISRTLKLIRKKDPSIYDSSISFFEAQDDKDSDDEDDSEDGEKKSKKKKEKKSKPLYYKDLVRQQVLAGDVEDSEDSDDELPVQSYAEEQQELKGAFMKSVAAAEDDEEEELDGGLFTKRKKTDEEVDAEEKAYEEFKEVHGNEIDNADEFLAKYMKSGAWKERKQIPRYDEIVGNENAVDDDEDEEELDKADAFEYAYNFRFEEEGGGQIQTFSRHIEDSLRRKDDKRKIAREERKARKALERQKKEEELRRLKNLKQAEIQSKLDKVSALMGGQKLTVADLDGDFDPEEHDRRMAEVFDDEYYGEEDNEKPTWDDDDEVFGKLPVEDEEDEDEENEVAADDNDGEEEAAEDDEEQEEETQENAEEEEEEPANDAEKPMTRAEMEAKKKQYLDELYSLDYEDLVGDLPTRFKYREVEKNDYGLTTNDILNADDKELKTVVSLKRLAPFADHEYKVNRRKVQQLRKALREKQRGKKQKGDEDAAVDTAEDAVEATKEEESSGSKKKRKRKHKKASKTKTEEENKKDEQDKDEEEQVERDDGPAKQKRKRKKKSKGSSETAAVSTAGLSSSRLESYRIKPLKK
ncbi:hypothetical protein LEN26_005906 [Aphanomyces euteiches]|nr:hypothetical protein AeMF1_021636 [Aphanomyces euteiches]KAH9137084.1 hypothetical protein LEN26_005906 [Aphanomyces euteiches]KAH9196133.1 hypothetical protein AeNC1_001910 [Aphanomyces euteiches]